MPAARRRCSVAYATQPVRKQAAEYAFAELSHDLATLGGPDPGWTFSVPYRQRHPERFGGKVSFFVQTIDGTMVATRQPSRQGSRQLAGRLAGRCPFSDP